MNKLEVRKVLIEAGVQASGKQIDEMIDRLNLPDELQPEHVERLKAHFQATQRPNPDQPSTNGNGKTDQATPEPINPAEANQQALSSLVQAKALMIHGSAQTGAHLADEAATQLLCGFAQRYAQNLNQIALLMGDLQNAQQMAIATDPTLAFHPQQSFFERSSFLPAVISNGKNTP